MRDHWRANQDAAIDAGLGPEDVEEPGRPHCWRCGAFLPAPSEQAYIYGYPDTVRYGARCGRCRSVNWSD